ncbi:anthranilate synthase component I family protein [Nitrospina sp. 32_T5]|uniref:anthranilate synthase component I family protein n=1 Tax=unclassified Nitrospina TaxID=2638683 RepID=UPI003F9E44BD
MKVCPDRSRFIELAATCPRVPVIGERRVDSFNPAEAYHRLYGEAERSFLFESGKGPDETARYSFFGRASEKALSLRNNQFQVHNNGDRETVPFPAPEALHRLNFEPGLDAIDYVDHFWGGWVGCLSYEMAHWFENIQPRAKDGLDLPLLFFFQVERLWVYDHRQATLKYIVAVNIEDDPETIHSQVKEELETAWREMDGLIEEASQSVPQKTSLPPSLQSASLNSNITQRDYECMVERAKTYIEEGDIYQANLAQRLSIDYEGDPFPLYQRLRKVNPSPFSGYLKFDGLVLASSSPERLVKVVRDRVETRPIAGTRPRGKNEEDDARLSAELLLNEKEKAEHLMLVDLERNDLGRICEHGSVQVTDLMFLEQYSHVCHIVSNIEGRLKPGVDVVDILAAVFPGGTITGCPKIRCMEIIDELEPSLRGPYSGSFGYIGFDRHLDLNIIIRTILIQSGRAHFHVGAGIVADSIPEKEWQETLDKAAAMIQALSGEPVG